jgi:hypothetical protein
MADDTAYSGEERPPATTTVRSQIVSEGNRKLGRSSLSGVMGPLNDALDWPRPEPEPVDDDDDKYPGIHLVPPLEDDESGGT